jgi:hypothetical protein
MSRVNERSAKFFGKHEVCCSIGGEVVPELPNPGPQHKVGIPGDPDVQQILDCLIRTVPGDCLFADEAAQ